MIISVYTLAIQTAPSMESNNRAHGCDISYEPDKTWSPDIGDSTGTYLNKPLETVSADIYDYNRFRFHLSFSASYALFTPTNIRSVNPEIPSEQLLVLPCHAWQIADCANRPTESDKRPTRDLLSGLSGIWIVIPIQLVVSSIFRLVRYRQSSQIKKDFPISRRKLVLPFDRFGNCSTSQYEVRCH